MQSRKFDEVIVKVIKSYDERTKSFRLGDKKVKLKDNHVKLIFGISCGNKEMAETDISKEDTALAKRCIKEPRLTTTTMKEKIKELKSSNKPEDIEDVVRLFCLFLCVTLLFSTSGTTVNWSFVYYMEDLAKVNDTKLREADKELKIYSNLGSKQEGGEIDALALEVEKVRMSVDGESPQQAEVSRE
ncbi:hypothetical protein RHSIM_Rhsim08G0172300 [Rhododendron simsii]|uniref:Uncharacterized protein n=1 Tax=Rhododendron simsii TaxID=118357 RepID=A0A834GM61_RHOSS|nr:hypothetical protein RHSIM_Rhsim08G0172300 [Rhododendron simsii]